MTNVFNMDEQRRAKLDSLRSIETRSLGKGLNHGGEDGTLPPMVPLRDYVDKADEAVETRLTAKLDNLATTKTIWSAIGTAVVAILGVILSVLAFGGDRFDAGFERAGQQVSQIRRDEVQDRALLRIERKLDSLVEASNVAENATNEGSGRVGD